MLAAARCQRSPTFPHTHTPLLILRATRERPSPAQKPTKKPDLHVLADVSTISIAARSTLPILQLYSSAFSSQSFHYSVSPQKLSKALTPHKLSVPLTPVTSAFMQPFTRVSS